MNFNHFTFKLEHNNTGTVETLRKTCAEMLKIQVPITIVRCRGTKAMILSDDSASLVGVLRDGDEIRVETTRDGKESRVMKIFDSVTNRITLKLFVKARIKRRQFRQSRSIDVQNFSNFDVLLVRN